MSDPGVTIAQLCEGMSRCVKEWILPHVDDVMARLQAEHLCQLLDELPLLCGAERAARVRTQNAEARALLDRLAATAPDPAADQSIDSLIAENTALRLALEGEAGRLRGSPEGQASERLRELQRFFYQVELSDLAAAKGATGSDFMSMSSRERGVKRS